MPEVLPISWNPDLCPRSVKISISTINHRDWAFQTHSHVRSQLVFTLRGMVNCEVEGFFGVVPSNCAVWIPGGLRHSLKGVGAAECCFLYLDPDCIPPSLDGYRTVRVTPLLRELMLEGSRQPEAYDENGMPGRLMATLIDQLAIAPEENLQLPLPREERMRWLAERLIGDPGDKTPLKVWGDRVGMSERNVSRLFQADVGMSFGRWRRQLHVVYALQRLISGERVQDIAFDLGYDNASGFITMFRKLVGKPPTRYLADMADTPSKHD